METALVSFDRCTRAIGLPSQFTDKNIHFTEFYNIITYSLFWWVLNSSRFESNSERNAAGEYQNQKIPGKYMGWLDAPYYRRSVITQAVGVSST